MKRFKKIVVLLVALTMLLSLATSASAAVTSVGSFVDDRLITEPFGADGSVTGEVKIVNATKKITTLTMENVLKEEGSDDYIAKLITEKQEGGTEGHAEFQTEFTKTNVENSTFSLNYDVKFDDMTATGGYAESLVFNTYNSSNKQSWAINRTVFVVSSTDSTKLTLYGYSGNSIRTNKWYHISHVFDNTRGVELMTITDENGFESKYTFPYDHTKVVAIDRCTIIPKVAETMYIDNIEVSKEDIVLTGFDTVFEVKSDITFNAMFPGNPTSAVVLCNDEIVGEIALESGKNVYDVTVNGDEIKNGNNEIVIAVSYADGTTKTASATAFVADVSVSSKDDVEEFTLYSKDFTGTSVPSGISCGYNETYRTKTETAIVDNALKVTATSHTGTSGTNYGDLRFAQSPYSQIKGSKYEISYDVNFSSFDASAADKTILKMSAVTQNGGWLINRELFKIKANDTNNVYLIGASSGSLSVGQWYHVKHVFDTASGKETVTVSNESGIVASATASASAVTEIRRFNFAFLQPSEVLFDNFEIYCKYAGVSSLASNVASYSPVSFDVVVPEDCTTAQVTADGVVIADIVPQTGKNIYAVSIAKDTLAPGTHEIGITAQSGGDTLSNSQSVTIDNIYDGEYGISLVNDALLTTEAETFDSLGNVAALDDGAAMNGDTFYDKYLNNWMTAGGTSNISRTAGKSGQSGDYALQIAYNNNPLFQLKKGNKGVRMADKGKFVMEFDLNLVKDGTLIQLDQVIPFWAATGNFIIAGNKVNVAGNVLETGKWYNFKMVLDIDNAKWYCYLDNELIIDGKPAVTLVDGVSTPVAVSDVKFDNIRVYSRTGGAFALDNIKVYRTELPVVTAESASYVKASESVEITDGVIPADASELAVTLSDAIDVTAEDVALYEDGVEIAASSVVSADGVVTIGLPALSGNSKLDVVIKDTADGIYTPVKESFCVTDASGLYFAKKGITVSDGVCKIVFEHCGKGSYKAIAAAYDGNKLTAVNSATAYMASGLTVVTLPAESEDGIKLMLWNSIGGLKPVIAAE